MGPGLRDCVQPQAGSSAAKHTVSAVEVTIVSMLLRHANMKLVSLACCLTHSEKNRNLMVLQLRCKDLSLRKIESKVQRSYSILIDDTFMVIMDAQ